MNEVEVAEKEFYLERYERELADKKDSAYVERQLQIDRELSLENAILLINNLGFECSDQTKDLAAPWPGRT